MPVLSGTEDGFRSTFRREESGKETGACNTKIR